MSSRLYLRIGFRATVLIGSAVAVTGALLTVYASVPEVAGTCSAVGVGLGLVAGPALIAAQSTVGWAQRGVVTGTNMSSRSTGTG